MKSMKEGMLFNIAMGIFFSLFYIKPYKNVYLSPFYDKNILFFLLRIIVFVVFAYPIVYSFKVINDNEYIQAS